MIKIFNNLLNMLGLSMKKITLSFVVSFYLTIANCFAGFHEAVELFEAEKYNESASLFLECHQNGNMLAYDYLKYLQQKNIDVDFKTSSTIEEFNTHLSSGYLKASQQYIAYINNQNKKKPILSLQALSQKNNSHAMILLGKIAEIEEKKPSGQKVKLIKKQALKKPLDYYLQAAQLYDRDGFLELKKLDPNHHFIKLKAFIIENSQEGAGEEKLADLFYKKNAFSEWAQWFLRSYLYGRRSNSKLFIDSVASNLIKNAVNTIQNDATRYQFDLPSCVNDSILDIVHFLAHEENYIAQNFMAALYDFNFKELANEHFPKNIKNAHFWYTKAAHNGDLLACYNSGYMSYTKFNKLNIFQRKEIQKDINEITNALNFLKKAALENYEDALNYLLALNEQIYLIAEDHRFTDQYIEALKMGYERPNINQESYAVRYIGLIAKHKNNDHLSEEALDAFTHKFLNNEHILNQIGVIYKDGLCGIEKSPEHTKKAISYFEKCLEIDPNYTDALYNLGHILLHHAIKYDLNKDVLFRIIDLSMRAFNTGEVDAAFDLGVAYSYLTEMGDDYSTECIKWCECSANTHNNAKAQLNLAMFHIQGIHNLSQDKDLILNYLDRSIEQNNTQAIALKIFMLLFLDFEQYQVEVIELFQRANNININWMQEVNFVLPLFDAFNNLKTLQQNELDEEALEDLTTDPVSSEADESSSEEDPAPTILLSSDTIEKKIQVELKNNKDINKKKKNKVVPKNKSLSSKIKLKDKESVILGNIMNKKSRKKVRWDEFVKLAQRYMKPGDSIMTTKHNGSKVKFDIAGNKLDIDIPKHNERAFLEGRRLEKVREFFENLKR